MENQNAQIKPIAYKYGLYSALASIIILIIMYLGNLDKNWILTAISLVTSILIFVFGIREYKLINANLLSVSQAIKVGLAIALIGGLVSGIYTYFHYELIYPEFLEIQKDNAYQQIINQNPDFTQEQINQAMSISSMFIKPSFFSIVSILGSLVFGLIISLITGLIMKSDN